MSCVHGGGRSFQVVQERKKICWVSRMKIYGCGPTSSYWRWDHLHTKRLLRMRMHRCSRLGVSSRICLGTIDCPICLERTLGDQAVVCAALDCIMGRVISSLHHRSTPLSFISLLHAIPKWNSSHATPKHANDTAPKSVNVHPGPMASRNICRRARPAPAQVQRMILLAACAEAGALGWRSVRRVPQNCSWD